MGETFNPVTFNNVIFSNNFATSSICGGMRIQDGSSTLMNVTFNGNSAHLLGGGMHLETAYLSEMSSDPSLTDVIFSNNICGQHGAGMSMFSASPTLIDVTLSGNHADYGGGILLHSSNPMLRFPRRLKSEIRWTMAVSP